MTAEASRRGRQSLLPLVVVIGSTLLSLLAAESFLRWMEPKDGSAGTALDYGAAVARKTLGPAGFLVENFAAQLTDGFGGTVRWRNDAHGFRSDREVTLARVAGTRRILFVGDSFVAGYRVDQADVFALRLERDWNRSARVPRLESLIAEVEDPVTAREYLDQYMSNVAPDLVVLGLTMGNDIDQVFHRTEVDASTSIAVEPQERKAAGQGIEALKALEIPQRCLDRRSDPERVEKGGSPSRWRLVRLLQSFLVHRRGNGEGEVVLPYFGNAMRPRLFDGNGLGLLLRDPPPEVETAFQRMEATLVEISRRAASQGSPLLIVLFAQRYEIQPPDWEATVEEYGLNRDCFDLGAARRRISAMGLRLGIPVLDPTSELRRRYEASKRSLFLPSGDMHWNAAGHQVVSDWLLNELEEARRMAPPVR